MSRSSTPAFRIEYRTNQGSGMMAWKSEYGNPDKDGLENWRQTYNASFQPGGVNGPRRETDIIVHRTSAQLIRQSTNEAVAEVYAPAFEII